MISRLRSGALLASLLLASSLVAVDHADARRGGSFGSRGARTFQMAPSTQTAPSFAPVQRSMTPNSGPRATQPGFNNQSTAGARRPGLFGGFGGGLLGGLLAGGLFGMLAGHGFGGAGGFMSLIIQMLLVGGGIMLLMRFFGRSRASAAHAGGQASYGGAGSNMYRTQEDPAPAGQGSFRIPSIGSMGGSSNAAPSGPSDEIGITDGDLDTFEQRLAELQSAFAREDYAALRRITTPEVMSYLAEELSDNATHGRKNDVSDVKLLQGDLSEAWREGEDDYASVAMRYSSIDVMRDRASGQVVEGDPNEPTETTELWTFRRNRNEDWKLSAIQER